jgi:hypothetical protein
MEIKVECNCGQRYKFDVEPINGRMPFPVSCPVCGANGTEKANEILARTLPIGTCFAPGAAPVGVLLSEPSSGPIASVAAPVAAPAAAAPAAPRIRLSTGHAQEASPTVTGAPPTPPSPPPLRAPLKAAPTAKPSQPASGKKPSFGLGLLGALIGATVGSLVYFLVFYYIGSRFKLLAVGVGYLAGIGAELLGRKEGSKELGMIAAVLTLVGIVSAQYLVARAWWNGGLHSRQEKSSYETSVADAKKVLKAMPNGSDEEIRLYLAKEEAEPGDKPDLKSISDEDIKEFRTNTLAETRDLASGKITREEWEKKNKAADANDANDKGGFLSEEGTFKAIFLLLLLSKVNLFSMAAAAGLAFKVCSNA